MTAFTLSDALATAAYANRNPSYAEYVKAAPVDQRAIVARWTELAKFYSPHDAGYYSSDEQFRAGAHAARCLSRTIEAQHPTPPVREIKPTPVQDNWDYGYCGSYQNYELGE